MREWIKAIVREVIQEEMEQFRERLTDQVMCLTETHREAVILFEQRAAKIGNLANEVEARIVDEVAKLDARLAHVFGKSVAVPKQRTRDPWRFTHDERQ